MPELNTETRKILKNVKPTADTNLQYAEGTLALIDPEFILKIPCKLGKTEFSVRAVEIIRECKALRMADTLTINVREKEVSVVSKGKKEKILKLDKQPIVELPKTDKKESFTLDEYVMTIFEDLNTYTKETPLIPSMIFVGFDGDTFQSRNLAAQYTWEPGNKEAWKTPFSFVPEPLKMIKGLFKKGFEVFVEDAWIVFEKEDLQFLLRKHEKVGNNVETDSDGMEPFDVEFLVDSALLKKIITEEVNKIPTMTDRRWLVPARFVDGKVWIGEEPVAYAKLPVNCKISAQCLQTVIDGNYVWFYRTLNDECVELIECEQHGKELILLKQRAAVANGER